MFGQGKLSDLISVQPRSVHGSMLLLVLNSCISHALVKLLQNSSHPKWQCFPPNRAYCKKISHKMQPCTTAVGFLAIHPQHTDFQFTQSSLWHLSLHENVGGSSWHKHISIGSVTYTVQRKTHTESCKQIQNACIESAMPIIKYDLMSLSVAAKIPSFCSCSCVNFLEWRQTPQASQSIIYYALGRQLECNLYSNRVTFSCRPSQMQKLQLSYFF